MNLLIVPSRLGLDHLIGTPALKPYMHGYFLSLKLYDTARLITNPFVYADHREKLVREKMDKLAETRIRSSKKDAVAGVKVNKGLAEKILKEEERAAQREERRRKKQGLPMESETPDLDVEMEDVENPEASASSSTADAKASKSLLNDSRFSAVFEDPDFEVDTTSKEYALLNPSSIGGHQNRGKTAVEEEDEESDNSMSSDGLGGSDHDDEAEEGGSDSDSSDEGGEFRHLLSTHNRSPRSDITIAPDKGCCIETPKAKSCNFKFLHYLFIYPNLIPFTILTHARTHRTHPL